MLDCPCSCLLPAFQPGFPLLCCGCGVLAAGRDIGCVHFTLQQLRCPSQIIQCYTPYLSGLQLFGADHARWAVPGPGCYSCDVHMARLCLPSADHVCFGVCCGFPASSVLGLLVAGGYAARPRAIPATTKPCQAAVVPAAATVPRTADSPAAQPARLRWTATARLTAVARNAAAQAVPFQIGRRQVPFVRPVARAQQSAVQAYCGGSSRWASLESLYMNFSSRRAPMHAAPWRTE